MASRYDGPSHNSDGRRRKKKSAVTDVLLSVLLVAALAVFGFSAFKLYGYYRDYKAGSDEYRDLADQYTDIQGNDVDTAYDGELLGSVEELEKSAAEVEAAVQGAAKEDAVENGIEKALPLLVNPINFEELNAINEDIIGWIRLGALDISYPVAQGEDNDYYLHRTFEKQDNFAGCIFLNYSNSKYFTDQNSIVYGHNMRNGSMFGTLKNLSDQELYEQNPYFWIFTPTLIYQYKIFSTREVTLGGDNDVYFTRYTTEDYQSFLDRAVRESRIKAEDITLSTDDRVVTLSTCTGNDATRFIVQGKLFQVYIAK